MWLAGTATLNGRKPGGRRINASKPAFHIGGDQPMELPELGQLIGTLGFPIVACCVVFWYLQKESENHKQEMNSMRDAVNANTSVIADLKMLMQQLIDKLS